MHNSTWGDVNKGLHGGRGLSGVPAEYAWTLSGLPSCREVRHIGEWLLCDIDGDSSE